MLRTATLFLAVLLTCTHGQVSAQDEDGGEAVAAAPAGRMVTIEATIVKLTGRLDVKDDAPATIDRDAAVQQWTEQGRLRSLQSIRFSALEGRKSLVQFGSRKPVVTGTAFPGRGGQIAQSFQMEEVGFLISARPTIEADGAIVVQLSVQRSDLDEASASGSTSVDAANAAIAQRTPPTIEIIRAETTVRVRDQAVIVDRKQEIDGDDQAETIVLLTARVAE